MNTADGSAVENNTALLSVAEQRALAWRLALALASGGCLILSIGLDAISPSQRDVAQLIAGIAAILVGGPALTAAWRSLRYPDLHGITDQLIALAFIAAWATGDLVTASLLPLIMTVGHILEERSLLGTHDAIGALTKLTQTMARRIEATGVVEVAARTLQPGDLIQVRAGDLVPADGRIETGSSTVDTSSVTGESLPAEVDVGDPVFSGSINLDGHLTVRLTRVGRETTLGRVIELMREAERTKPAITRVLEQYAGRYLMFVLLLSACVWFLTGSTAGMLAVLVASCPCALVLAAPATSVAAIAVAGRHGILVKGASFLEQLATVDTVVFDKTGTLTRGQLQLVGSTVQPGGAKAALVRLAGSLGANSSHPVSRALCERVPESERLPIIEVKETRGLGITGYLNGNRVAIGRPLLFAELGINATPPPSHDGPIAGVSSGDTFLGWLLFADEVRAEAKDALEQLRNLGLRRQLVVTGDTEREARKVAAQLDVAEVHAEVLPAEKMKFVLEEVQNGRRPMVVGDGINDALALKAGTVGVAMGAQGSDIALASADLVLMTNDLRRLATCVRLSRRCRRTILVNMGLGLGWTVVIVAMAAAGTFGASGALVAAVAHNVGTVAVMLNAGHLLRFLDAPSA